MRSDARDLLDKPEALARHIGSVLYPQTARVREEIAQIGPDWTASAVLFLLRDPPRCAPSEGPSLILNKRSNQVPQPGDLCCPGGGMAPWLDPLLARMLHIPGSALQRSPVALRLPPAERHEAARLLATALREGFEEMRLQPLGVSFLGLLPAQRLLLLRRAIYPVVARLDRFQPFRPNWEVDRIVAIPLRHLLDPLRYARLRVRFEDNPTANEKVREDFVCFRHREAGHDEILWGATFRITAIFLERAFDFRPPSPASLPLVHTTLDARYLTGKPRADANGRRDR